MTNESPFKGWKFLKSKEGGANESGEYGGVYERVDGDTKAMIKKESFPAKNISEFLGSKIFEAISPGNGAQVSILAPNRLEDKISRGEKSKNTDSNIYVKSEFFKNYSDDMYVDMDKYMSPATKPNSWFRKNGGRPLFMGIRNLVYRTYDKAFEQLKYQGFEKVMPASLLIGDFDIHAGNIGIVRDTKTPNLLPQMVRIDFAGSLDKLTNKIHPNSRMKHLPGFGPTNHFREFPSYLRRNNPEFADSLLAASKNNLDSTIDKSFEEISKYYSNDALTAWAKQAMPKIFNNKKPQEVTPEEIKNSFKTIIKKRQESLQEYGLEVKLSTLITKKLTAPYYQVDEKKLKTLIQEYPDHFKKIINYEKGKKDGKKLKLSDKSLRSILLKKTSAEKYLIEKITDLRKSIKTEIISNLTRKIEELEEKLKQRVIEDNKVTTSKISKLSQDIINQKANNLLSVLQENILNKQQALLAAFQKKFGENKIKDNYLIQKDFENKVNSLEISGYKKLLAAADFQPINWDRAKTANKKSIKTTTIRKDDKELFTLTETAINIPINITENDEKKTIFIHRKIDFPINIVSPETSISLSLVLQDSHGQNMLLSKAVYFTVHYNEQGQLIKISNPLGLKFSGTDKNAIGYIEREGNIYTLPVTKGKYEEMKREIEKNQNINKVVEKSIELLSADFLSTTDLEIIQKVSNTITAKENNTYSSTTHMTPNKKANRGKG